MVSNKEVASLIIDFVQNAVKNKVVGEDYVESMDVVVSCISDAFEVETDEAAKIISDSFGGQGLLALLDGAAVESKKNASVGDSSKDGSAVPVNISGDETERKAKAEALKVEGNKLMAQKDYEGAIAKYTAAIEEVSTNAVYYSNRAAAYSSSGKHNLAIKDANKAIELDPTYARAYSRLGLANYALGDAKAALEAYKKGLEIEGDKPSPGMTKGYETAKKRVEDEGGDVSSSDAATTDRSTESSSGGLPDLAGLASSLGGGSGGMPDFSSMMNNPQIMQAAQRMMQDPNAMSNLMNNPMLQQMAGNFGLGGGSGSRPSENGGSGSQPNLDDLLNNPLLQNLASSFMGGNRNGANNGGQ